MATSITTTQSTRQYPLSRYDDRNIADPILRAELRKEVMLMCESNDKNLTIYYVLPDEQYRPDLLAYPAFMKTAPPPTKGSIRRFPSGK